jgi:hypothetical protein
VIGEEEIAKIPVEAWAGADVKASMDEIERMEEIVQRYTHRVSRIKSHFDERQERLSQGDELAPGVIKMVKVYVAVKRKLAWATRWRAATATRASFQDPSRGGHALLQRRNPGRYCLKPPGRTFQNERGPGSGSPPGMGVTPVGQADGGTPCSLKDVGSVRKKLADIFSPEEYKDISKTWMMGRFSPRPA